MNDTRLLPIIRDMEDSLEGLAGLLAENIRNIHDGIDLARAEKLLTAALAAVKSAAKGTGDR